MGGSVRPSHELLTQRCTTKIVPSGAGSIAVTAAHFTPGGSCAPIARGAVRLRQIVAWRRLRACGERQRDGGEGRDEHGRQTRYAWVTSVAAGEPSGL